jgi:hypothetical protein
MPPVGVCAQLSLRAPAAELPIRRRMLGQRTITVAHTEHSVGGLCGHHPALDTAVIRASGICPVPRISSPQMPGLRRPASPGLPPVQEDPPDVAGGRLPVRSMRVRNKHRGAEGDGLHASSALPDSSMCLAGRPPSGWSRARGKRDTHRTAGCGPAGRCTSSTATCRAPGQLMAT